MKPIAPAPEIRLVDPPSLVVGAVPHETRRIEETLQASELCRRPWRLFQSPRSLFLTCGIGPANAAAALSWVLATRKVSQVINLGSAGSFDLDLLPLEAVAEISEDHFGDMGSQLDEPGWVTSEDLQLFLREGESNRFPCQVLAHPELDMGFPLRRATAITVHHVTGTVREAQLRRERTGALVESMEGAALALVCLRFQVPFHQLRGISNAAGAPRGDWRFREAGENAQRAALELFQLGQEASR